MHNDNKPPQQWVPFDVWLKTSPVVELEQLNPIRPPLDFAEKELAKVEAIMETWEK